jgi:hypothetical protein
MKVSDFKLLATMPDEYDYETFNWDGCVTAIGKKHQTIIGFRIENNELIQIRFENKKEDKKR